MKDEEINPLLLILGLLIICPSILWSGWVFLKYWGWFAIPILNLPIINYKEAIMLNMFFAFLFYHRKIRSHLTREQKYLDYKDELWSAFVDPLIFLVMGWVIHMILM